MGGLARHTLEKWKSILGSYVNTRREVPVSSGVLNKNNLQPAVVEGKHFTTVLRCNIFRREKVTQ